MIDLDAIWTEEDELYCHLAIAIWLDGKFSYYDWCALTMGFGLYKKVEFEDTTVSDKLVDALIAYYRDRKNLHWLHQVATFIDCCKGTYSEPHQERLAELILARAPARMEKSPENCGIIDVQEFEDHYDNREG